MSREKALFILGDIKQKWAGGPAPEREELEFAAISAWPFIELTVEIMESRMPPAIELKTLAEMVFILGVSESPRGAEIRSAIRCLAGRSEDSPCH